MSPTMFAYRTLEVRLMAARSRGREGLTDQRLILAQLERYWPDLTDDERLTVRWPLPEVEPDAYEGLR